MPGSLVVKYCVAMLLTQGLQGSNPGMENEVNRVSSSVLATELHAGVPLRKYACAV